MDDLFTWINDGLKENGWSSAELARRAGLSRGTISSTMNGRNAVTWDFCAAIAKAFSVPVDSVFRRAGLMKPLPDMSDTMFELQSVISGLDEVALEIVTTYAIFVYKRQLDGEDLDSVF